jgi:hypothetical protein
MSEFRTQTPALPQPGPRDEITIGKIGMLTPSGEQAEVFTMTLGGETINLMPLRNWGQLDVYKWGVRGKLPGTPAGLEITFDHVKVAGEIVSTKAPEGTAKLQKLFNEWLALERGTLELARKKALAKPTAVEPQAALRPEPLVPHFQVEVDKEGIVHLHCRQGKETLATIGLNLPGFNSLFNQGLMHKPHSLKVGALHDWVELDGELFSFEKGNNDASKLEKALNDRYLSATALGQGKDVVVFTNDASSTGFDIQFPAKVGGVIDHRRRPLNEESLGLLQDAEHCGLLPKDLVIKLSRPNLIFKRKTPDGGERYLNRRPENIITMVGDEGQVRTIDLSQPVNFLHLTAVELTAVFNHPAINQHGKASPQPSRPAEKPGPAHVPAAAAERPLPPPLPVSQSRTEASPIEVPKPQPGVSPPREPPKAVPPKPGEASTPKPAQATKPSPNAWMKPILARPAIRHDWFACLTYSKMAEYFGNSNEGILGPGSCWASSLGDVEDVADPAFRGVFFTERNWLGYLNHGHIARFRNEVAFIGTLESSLEGIGVSLVAVGTDVQQRIAFIVTDGYRAKFGSPEQTVIQELARLKEHGAWVVSVSEVLHSPEPLELIWTVPADQENPDEPQALEHPRPGSPGEDPNTENETAPYLAPGNHWTI